MCCKRTVGQEGKEVIRPLSLFCHRFYTHARTHARTHTDCSCYSRVLNAPFTNPVETNRASCGNKLVRRAKMDGATLTIHSVTLTDSGDYRCEVTASEDHVNLGEATVTLNVLVPPHIPSCDVPSSVFVGSALELLCKDKLKIQFTRIRPSFFKIYLTHFEQKFRSVSKLDAGMYRCESSNSVGAPKSCVAHQLKVVDCKFF
uniref:Junctional adhesion molecule B-like n=1 Tax=Gouania willdenowi TaxID=441366 RepID=A0A8C5GNN3_GOUWI